MGDSPHAIFSRVDFFVIWEVRETPVHPLHSLNLPGMDVKHSSTQRASKTRSHFRHEFDTWHMHCNGSVWVSMNACQRLHIRAIHTAGLCARAPASATDPHIGHVATNDMAHSRGTTFKSSTRA